MASVANRPHSFFFSGFGSFSDPSSPLVHFSVLVVWVANFTRPFTFQFQWFWWFTLVPVLPMGPEASAADYPRFPFWWFRKSITSFDYFHGSRFLFSVGG